MNGKSRILSPDLPLPIPVQSCPLLYFLSHRQLAICTCEKFPSTPSSLHHQGYKFIFSVLCQAANQCNVFLHNLFIYFYCPLQKKIMVVALEHTEYVQACNASLLSLGPILFIFSFPRLVT